jgi:hypothetical protein
MLNLPTSPRRRTACALALIPAALLLFATSSAYGLTGSYPDAGTPLTALTPGVIFTSLLALVIAFVAEGVNTGKIGTLAVPTSWIPKLTIALSFLGPFGVSEQGAANPLSGLALANAIQAGFLGLLAAGSGSALLGHATRHLGKKPDAVQKAANDLGAQRGFIEVRSLLFGLVLFGIAIITSAGIMVAIAGCSPSQQKTVGTVENAIFSADQVACIVANAGYMGDSNAVQEFEQACNIAPALEGPLSQLIATLIGDPATAARLKASGLRKGAGQ